MDPRARDGRWRTIATVYAAWLLAALVAAALGSGRLLASAERQPFGPRRDALVAAATAFDALGGRLGLDGPARGLARAIGRAAPAAPGAAPTATAKAAAIADGPSGGTGTAESQGATSAPVSTAFLPAIDRASAGAPPAATSDRPPGRAMPRATPTAAPLARRPITPEDPLRVHVAGDSFAEPLGYQLATYATRDRLLSIGMDFRISTGLVRRDYFDWQARMVETLAAPTPPEVVVFFLGANEDQNMQVDDEVLLMGTEAWQDEYERRAGALMDLFEAPGISLVWVGMPDMRESDMVAAMAALTRAVESAARTRPWVTLIDTRPLFRGPDGGFAAFLPSPNGELVRMRGEDGIHLTRPGTNLVAERVYALLERSWDLRTPTPTPTATATPTATPSPTARATPTAFPSGAPVPSPTSSPRPGFAAEAGERGQGEDAAPAAGTQRYRPSPSPSSPGGR